MALRVSDVCSVQVVIGITHHSDTTGMRNLPLRAQEHCPVRVQIQTEDLLQVGVADDQVLRLVRMLVHAQSSDADKGLPCHRHLGSLEGVQHQLVNASGGAEEDNGPII